MTVARVLIDALAQYRDNNAVGLYDETLDVVVQRVNQAGYLTKADIGSLVLWKRISAQARWATDLGMTPDTEVRATTGKAYELANDATRTIPDAGQEARWALNSLPGMSGRSEGALASAVLVACAPLRMAVWDRRVKAALELPAVDFPVRPGDRYYGRYLAVVVQLREAMVCELGEPVTPRDVDLALWQVGGSWLRASAELAPQVRG